MITITTYPFYNNGVDNCFYSHDFNQININNERLEGDTSSTDNLLSDILCSDILADFAEIRKI